MTKRKIYAPARRGLKIPMPDRDGRLMPESGVPIDMGKSFYRRLFDDGDIVEVKSATAKPAERGNRKPK